MQKLASYALIFVVVGMVLGFGALIMSETQDQIDTVTGSTTSYAHNITQNTMSGMDTMGSWQPILAIVIVAGIVISLLLGSFMIRTAGKA